MLRDFTCQTVASRDHPNTLLGGVAGSSNIALLAPATATVHHASLEQTHLYHLHPAITDNVTQV
jgi:hypothetical protein